MGQDRTDAERQVLDAARRWRELRETAKGTNWSPRAIFALEAATDMLEAADMSLWALEDTEEQKWHESECLPVENADTLRPTDIFALAFAPNAERMLT